MGAACDSSSGGALCSCAQVGLTTVATSPPGFAGPAPGCNGCKAPLSGGGASSCCLEPGSNGCNSDSDCCPSYEPFQCKSGKCCSGAGGFCGGQAIQGYTVGKEVCCDSSHSCKNSKCCIESGGTCDPNLPSMAARATQCCGFTSSSGGTTGQICHATNSKCCSGQGGPCATNADCCPDYPTCNGSNKCE